MEQLFKTDRPGVVWMGNDGWLLWDGARLLATDLDLHSAERLSPSPGDLSLLAQRLELLMITHAHDDHFRMETCRMLAEQGSCRFLIPESCLEKARPLPQERVQYVKPGDSLSLAGAEIACVRAVHGHIQGSVYSGASLLDCGYRLRFGGSSFYQPGDTLLLEEHLSMEPVDVLFVSPTEHNTWVEDSLRLIGQLSPKRILAQHFGTYREHPGNLFWAHGYTRELRDALSPEQQARYHIPEQGAAVPL